MSDSLDLVMPSMRINSTPVAVTCAQTAVEVSAKPLRVGYFPADNVSGQFDESINRAGANGSMGGKCKNADNALHATKSMTSSTAYHKDKVKMHVTTNADVNKEEEEDRRLMAARVIVELADSVTTREPSGANFSKQAGVVSMECVDEPIINYTEIDNECNANSNTSSENKFTNTSSLNHYLDQDSDNQHDFFTNSHDRQCAVTRQAITPCSSTMAVSDCSAEILGVTNSQHEVTVQCSHEPAVQSIAVCSGCMKTAQCNTRQQLEGRRSLIVTRTACAKHQASKDMSPNVLGTQCACKKRMLHNMEASDLPLKKRKLFADKQQSQVMKCENDAGASTPEVLKKMQCKSKTDAGLRHCESQKVQHTLKDATKDRQASHRDAQKALHLQRLIVLRADNEGDLPLHIAVAQENLAMVVKLIVTMRKMNVGLDHYNQLRQTPLHLAAITQSANLMKALLVGGANAGLPNRNGNNVYHLVVQHPGIECLLLLLRHRNFNVADLNAKNYDGFSALHLAVLSGNAPFVCHLLDAGAETDIPDGKSGRTPLFHAAECNQLQIARLLLAHDATVTVPCYSGSTAVNAASGRGHSEIVTLLTKHGADPVGKDTTTTTTAVAAVEKQTRTTLHNALALKKRNAPATTATKTKSSLHKSTFVETQPGVLDLSAKQTVVLAGHTDDS